MIAKYQNNYFKISMRDGIADLWCYLPVDGFDVVVESDGFTYYEKFVPLAEIDEIFDVGFSAKWHGKWCGSSPLENNEVQLITNDRQFARKYDMEEFEHEVFWRSASMDECTEFKMEIEDVVKETSQIKTITRTEFIDSYQRYVRDLIPPKN